MLFRVTIIFLVTSFDVGIVENDKLYSGHAKLSRSSEGAILDFLAKVNRGSNVNGQLKFTLKDSVNANGQFKVTDNSGKGNGVLIIEFKRVDETSC